MKSPKIDKTENRGDEMSWTKLLDDIQYMEYMFQSHGKDADVISRGTLDALSARTLPHRDAIFDMVCERFKRLCPNGLRIYDTDVTREGCYDERK